MRQRLLADIDLPPPTRRVATAQVVTIRGGRIATVTDRLVGEEPMGIRAAGPGQEPVNVAVTMRTPGNEAELAVGFLVTEGLIAPGDVVDVSVADAEAVAQPDDIVTVRLRRPFDATIASERHFVATASCGICGKATLDEITVRCTPLPAGPVVTPDVITPLPSNLREAQPIFARTGGVHAAGLFDARGHVACVREDVGRHNAVDKVVGSEALAGRLPLHDRILMVSGRVSFEIVQKAAVAGIPIVCAVSAPSDLAVEAADRLGMTLVGFLRGDSFNVYAHPERIRA